MHKDGMLCCIIQCIINVFSWKTNVFRSFTRCVDIRRYKRTRLTATERADHPGGAVGDVRRMLSGVGPNVRQSRCTGTATRC